MAISQWRPREIKKSPQLGLELGNMELELKPTHSYYRIIELNFLLRVDTGLELDRHGVKHWPCHVGAEWH